MSWIAARTAAPSSSMTARPNTDSLVQVTERQLVCVHTNTDI